MFRYILLAMGGFVIAYSIAGVLGTILQCVPPSVLLKSGESSRVCINFRALITAMAVVNIVTDVIILSLPIPLVWSLQVSKSRRWQLVINFSLGGL